MEQRLNFSFFQVYMYNYATSSLYMRPSKQIGKDAVKKNVYKNKFLD